jgi:MFS transporter, MHS family, proline/betaine transporter
MSNNVNNKKNIIVPGSLGNVLEWYDFSLYGYFAAIISSLFFPGGNQTVSLIKTFGVFAVGFLMRPIGAILFGHFGDRWGRKKTLAASVILMAIPTVLMGLLPTHAQIGVWAGILLTLCRLLQGLAVGGEQAGSIVYLIEHAPDGRRGLYGSWTMFSAFTGLLIGSAVGAITSGLAAGTAYADIAWRLPFLFGIVLAGIGLYLRLRMPETPNFTELLSTGRTIKHPFLQALREKPGAMLQGTLLVFLPAMGFYLAFVYLSSYLKLYLKLPLDVALTANSISMLIILLVIPFVGRLSDRIGRKPTLIMGAVATCILAYPLFLLLGQGTFAAALIAQIIFALLTAFCYAAVPAALVEMFATKMRYSAMAFSYNLSNTIFGGTAPLVATYLIHATRTIYAPSFYLIFAGIVMLIIVLCLKETYKQQLS